LTVQPWAVLLLMVLLGWGAILSMRWHRLRRQIRAIAQGGHERLFATTGPAWYLDSVRDLNRISERLAEGNQQAADEGLNLRAVLGAMVEGALITDASQRVRVVNGALLRMFGLEQPPADRTVMELFRSHELHSAVSATLAGGTPRVQTMRIEAGIGDAYVIRDFEVNLSPLRRGPDSPAGGVIAVFHDISELKTQERFRKELVANVSHELRTPLSIVHGYVETLLDGALDDRPTAERFLRVMHRHGERLNLLIDDLLTLSRIESGAAELHLEPVDLREAVDKVLARLDPDISGSGARVEVDFPAGLPRVPADPHRIDQLLFNLLDNALKFGPANGARVWVTATIEPNSVTVSVTDNGPGIPAADQPHLFERFYRVQKDRNRDAGGTGLGLSIVKQIVVAHGGRVGIESTPGHGATFRFTLPVSS
jgi:two-component system phosphate regulon sensor histidine kinase PhoR